LTATAPRVYAAAHFPMIRIALLAVGILGAVLLALVAFGYALPVGHVAALDADLSAPPDRVFAALVDVEAFPKWRSDVKDVELVGRAPLRWREHGGNDTIAFEAQEVDAPRRLVTRITDKSLPFGGSWTFELRPSGGGTHVRIIENGEVYNPLFRVVSRYVFGHTATIDRYLTDLQKYLR
jgi:uncharacterized protein YndB with AHSA1/START domain